MSFTVFCFGAATPNLEVQKIKKPGSRKIQVWAQLSGGKVPIAEAPSPLPSLQCHGARCQWLKIWSDLTWASSFLGPPSLMNEPNL